MEAQGRTFVLIVVDHDTGEFTVEGPMGDDRPWVKAVVEVQKVGRNIRCHHGDTTPDEAAAEWQGANGGHRVSRQFDRGLLVGFIVL